MVVAAETGAQGVRPVAEPLSDQAQIGDYIRQCRGWDDVERCLCDLVDTALVTDLRRGDGPEPQYTPHSPEAQPGWTSWLADMVKAAALRRLHPTP